MLSIYWDSCIFIYYTEAIEETRQKIREKFLPYPRSILCHTPLTELECRVEPLRNGKHELLACYDRLFAAPHTQRLALSEDVYRLATELRAEHRLKTPDALHLAAALNYGCDSFWTRDDRLGRATEGRIKLIVPV